MRSNRREIRGLVLLFLFAWLASGFVHAADYSAVCEIRAEQGRFTAWMGSGTLIGVTDTKALVLTARHVADHVGQPISATWRWAGRGTTRGAVVAIVRGDTFNNDLALVVVGRPAGIEPCKVVEFEAAKGPFTAVGYRNGKMRVTTTATASASDGLVELPAPLVQGMSGGPVFDGAGHVIAVGVGSDFETRALCADGVSLRNLVNSYRKK